MILGHQPAPDTEGIPDGRIGECFDTVQKLGDIPEREPTAGSGVLGTNCSRRSDHWRAIPKGFDALTSDERPGAKIDDDSGMGKQPPQIGPGLDFDRSPKGAPLPDASGTVLDHHDVLTWEAGGQPPRQRCEVRAVTFGIGAPIAEDHHVVGEAEARVRTVGNERVHWNMETGEMDGTLGCWIGFGQSGALVLP